MLIDGRRPLRLPPHRAICPSWQLHLSNCPEPAVARKNCISIPFLMLIGPLAVARTTPERSQGRAKSIFLLYPLKRLGSLTNGFHFTCRLAADKLATPFLAPDQMEILEDQQLDESGTLAPCFDSTARDQVYPPCGVIVPTCTPHVLARMPPVSVKELVSFWAARTISMSSESLLDLIKISRAFV